MPPRIATLAKRINASGLFRAVIEPGYCNTDRKVGRLRIPGKGRYGNHLKVYESATGKLVLDHNAAETYRHNGEIVQWMAAQGIG